MFDSDVMFSAERLKIVFAGVEKDEWQMGLSRGEHVSIQEFDIDASQLAG
ncbi:hypothetical protein [Vibrio navarrensis]|nr:hypothetical protein [Vibrio navarrensis]